MNVIQFFFFFLLFLALKGLFLLLFCPSLWLCVFLALGWVFLVFFRPLFFWKNFRTFYSCFHILLPPSLFFLFLSQFHLFSPLGGREKEIASSGPQFYFLFGMEAGSQISKNQNHEKLRVL